MAHEKYESCIEACVKCAQECEHCADACLSDQDGKKTAEHFQGNAQRLEQWVESGRKLRLSLKGQAVAQLATVLPAVWKELPG